MTAEDQIPIVEVDDSYSSSLMQDFLWFTKVGLPPPNQSNALLAAIPTMLKRVEEFRIEQSGALPTSAWHPPRHILTEGVLAAQLSCMWEDVRWLRQSTSVSTSSSSTLQARHKMLSAAGQLQNLLGTHNLGRAHYEPIKDRHGNVLLVTVRDADGQHALLSGKWMQVAKVQSQRKSLSTPEEPYALDVLVITLQVPAKYLHNVTFHFFFFLFLKEAHFFFFSFLCSPVQDIVAYQRRSSQRLAPGLYLGYLKLSSSVDQIRVLVSQRNPNMLCHARVRENANVSR